MTYVCEGIRTNVVKGGACVCDRLITETACWSRRNIWA